MTSGRSRFDPEQQAMMVDTHSNSIQYQKQLGQDALGTQQLIYMFPTSAVVWRKMKITEVIIHGMESRTRRLSFLLTAMTIKTWLQHVPVCAPRLPQWSRRRFHLKFRHHFPMHPCIRCHSSHSRHIAKNPNRGHHRLRPLLRASPSLFARFLPAQLLLLFLKAAISSKSLKPPRAA